MKNAKSLVPALAVILCVSLSCTFLKNKISNSGTNNASVRIPNIPPFDPDGPMVSPGAYVIRIMAKDEPELAALTDQVEAAERKMMKEIIDENRPKAQANNENKKIATLTPSAPNSITNFEAPPAAAHFMLQSRDVSLPTAGDGVFFGGFTGYLKGMLAGALIEGSFNKKDTKTETVEGGTSKMNVEIGANPDGSTVFEIGIITETEKNGIKARTELKSRIEGQDCPNAEGQVPMTIKLRIAGQAGSSRFEQDVTAFVRVVVDDNADIASTTIDATQATARGRNGNNVFIESGFTHKREAGQPNDTISNERVIRESDNSTAAEKYEAAQSGNEVVFGAVNAAIGTAKSAWQGGACIKIDAKSPGTVDMNSSTSIPVKVFHKKEGTDLAAKLESTLKGAVSIDPALIPRTPGTMTYVAPGEPGKNATITLTATCRRGRATLDLQADTGKKAYKIKGQSNGVSFEGFICNMTQPFTLNATFPGGTAEVKFNIDGSTSTDGGGGGCTMKGAGTYKLHIGDDDTGTLKWTTTDKLSCPGFGNSRTMSFDLTVQPAPDHHCS